MIYVGVIGAGHCSGEIWEAAVRAGEMLAENNAVLLCGGHGGVMEAAAMGAAQKNGTVLGILPGTSREDGNPYLTLALATGLGEARNAVIARASDVLIAISGGAGTLSEIGLALKMGRKVIGLYTWKIISPGKEEPGLIHAGSAGEAVRLALRAGGDGK